jgi:hypothetical protein
MQLSVQRTAAAVTAPAEHAARQLAGAADTAAADRCVGQNGWYLNASGLIRLR